MIELPCVLACSEEQEAIKDMPHREIVVNGRKTPPSLVDLCVNTAIDNLRYLGDVGETDLYLLDRILPHCTLDQLMHVEKSSQVGSAAFNLCH